MSKDALTGRTSGLLRDQIQVVRVANGGKPKYTIKPLEEKLSFDKGFYVFIRAIQALTSKSNDVIVVGLAGASGAGKTAFASKVEDFIPGSVVLSMDMYNDATRLIDGNFDDPRLTDYDLLLANLQDLKDGKAIQAPIYSFVESRRVGFKQLDPPSSRVVIVEGIYALSSRMGNLLDLRVSITGGVHFDLVKRVLRDISRSEQAPQDIIQQIGSTVFPMYKAYIEPDLKAAHLQIHNKFNPFSGFMNPTYILKSPKRIPAEEIKAVLKEGSESSEELETYDIYLLPPNEDPETCQSWLRMRNRSGRYMLMFEEWVTDGSFIITPRITFEVSVHVLGGLMALGYEIGTIMKRSSTLHSDDSLTIKTDDIEGMDQAFTQIQGKSRELVSEAGKKLGLEGTYIARSYIEQIQLAKLTASFQNVTADLRRRFVVDGEPLLDEHSLGASPRIESHRRISGFSPQRLSHTTSAPLSTSAPIHMPGILERMENVNGAQTRTGSGHGSLLSAALRGDGNGTSHHSLAAVGAMRGPQSRRSSEESLHSVDFRTDATQALPKSMPRNGSHADQTSPAEMQVEGRVNMVLDRLHSFQEASSSRFDSQAQAIERLEALLKASHSSQNTQGAPRPPVSPSRRASATMPDASQGPSSSSSSTPADQGGAHHRSTAGRSQDISSPQPSPDAARHPPAWRGSHQREAMASILVDGISPD
ncbi:hypothetical protein WJX84_000932 [Apatococcus fuscideae]|uniref:CYTH domain-containing protein n=1 Tax=Apatococcus fuscideae TaxID=2026836 RepID=A0AAW1TGG3_9CHLO